MNWWPILYWLMFALFVIMFGLNLLLGRLLREARKESDKWADLNEQAMKLIKGWKSAAELEQARFEALKREVEKHGGTVIETPTDEGKPARPN